MSGACSVSRVPCACSAGGQWSTLPEHADGLGSRPSSPGKITWLIFWVSILERHAMLTMFVIGVRGLEAKMENLNN